MLAPPPWKTPEIDAALLAKFHAGPERAGVVLSDGEIVELVNEYADPENGAVLDLTPLIEISDQIVATWHTHPDATANLSSQDSESFVMWPQCLHAIVGTDGLRWYAVKGPAVVNA